MDLTESPRPAPQVPRSRAVTVVTLLGGLSLTWAVLAQPPAAPQPDPAAEAPNPAAPKAPASSLDQLVVEQGKIADKYARLEQLLIRMSELEATNNPQRAALLKRAAQQSSEKLTRQQLGTLLKLMTPPAQLKRAVDGQQQVLTDLKGLLELLQSENRSDRLKSDQARLKDYLKEVERLIRLQQGIQGRTEGGDDAKKLGQDQAQIADRTAQLAERVRESEEAGKQEPGKQEPGKQEPGKQEPGKQESGKQEPGKQEPGKQEPGKQEPGKQEPGKQEPGKQDSKSGSPSESPPMPAEGSEKSAESGEESKEEQGEENPARKRLEAAEDRMREAQKKLAETKRQEAAGEQEKAREELEKARQELEQILRQMREEEMERALAMLEGRFRRMLEAELKVYESTKRLDKIPAAERTRDVDIQASKLGFEQGKIVVEADKALMLLREEGSSVAFPETVEMMRDDMQQVADRLSGAQVDRLTQGIEEEIIATLEELVAAMQKAQQDLKDKKPPPPGQPGQQGDPSQRPLVDSLAELKMIRALQMRVNTRTQRYSRLLENADDPIGRANDSELRASLTKLAELELKVLEITRNVVLGKNK